MELKWKQAYANSEYASCPRTELEKKFAILHLCPECNEYSFCISVKHPADTKCECKTFQCFRCFNTTDDVEMPYAEHVKDYWWSDDYLYPYGSHVIAFIKNIGTPYWKKYFEEKKE